MKKPRLREAMCQVVSQAELLWFIPAVLRGELEKHAAQVRTQTWGELLTVTAAGPLDSESAAAKQPLNIFIITIFIQPMLTGH